MKLYLILIPIIILSCSNQKDKIGYIDFNKFLKDTYSDFDFEARYKRLDIYKKTLHSLISNFDSLKNTGVTDTIEISDSIKSLYAEYLGFLKNEISGSAVMKQLNEKYGEAQDVIWDKIYEEIYHDLNLSVIIDKHSLENIYPYDSNSIITEKDSASGFERIVEFKKYDTTGTIGIDITNDMISRCLVYFEKDSLEN